MTQRVLLALFLAFAAWPALSAPDNGLVVSTSRHDVAETARRAVAAAEARGLKLFARIDHAEGAKNAGLELPPTVLLLFGNPKAGTPLMHCSRTVAIDLPQKLLIWEDGEGVTRIAYNAPAWLDARHQLGDGCTKVLEKVGGALSGIAASASE